jgi:23S rRNA (cytosine1962-C5)-methyltransferase
MNISKLYLKPKKEESLLRFHPWIFSGAVASIKGKPVEGDVVEVYSSDNCFLGIGHYQTGSIVIRILSFEQTEIDRSFWISRINAARKLRLSLGLAGSASNNAYRLVHGEGDLLPGLVVDIYAQTAVVQAHSAGMHHARKEIANALREVMGDTLHRIYYKSEGTLPFKADLNEENEYLYDDESRYGSDFRYDGDKESFTAIENGFTFYIDWLKGQKTGFFIDQRENRSLVQQYAKGRAVLNMFCYSGGFSVYALHGGATIVHSVDSSAKAIALTNENVRLNFPDDTRHRSFAEDAFKFMDNIDNQYDLIVLDPPAFAKHKNVLRNALQGYRKLNAIAFKKIKPGGVIFTFSCSQIVNKNDFRLAVFSAAAQSGRAVRILHQLTQPADHPINIYHPEGEYLKGLALQVE